MEILGLLQLDPDRPTSQDTQRIILSFVTRNEQGQIRNITDNNADGFPLYLPDLTLTTLLRSKAETGERPSPEYGSDLSYNRPYSVGLHTAEAMAKTLKAIHKRTEKIARQFGYARDFTECAAHLCAALGIETIITVNPSPGWDWDSVKTREYAIADLRFAVERLEESRR